MAKTLENTATSNGSGDPPQPATDDDPSGAATSDADNDKKQLLLRIAVGTTNPCKIAAVKKAVEKAMDTSAAAAANNGVDRKVVELHIEGFAVESGVPGQPFGDVSLVESGWNRSESIVETDQWVRRLFCSTLFLYVCVYRFSRKKHWKVPKPVPAMRT